MKTNAELLRFYEIEIGKKYKITDQSVSMKINYRGHSFRVGKDSDNYIRIELFGIYKELAILDDLVYEKVKEPLTDEEKDYLRAVIKPFRDEIKSFYKTKAECYFESGELFFINLQSGDYFRLPELPPYKMFNGMEQNYAYTLDELGL